MKRNLGYRLSRIALAMVIVALFVPHLLKGQQQEIGGFAGGANYFGELNPNYSFRYTRPAFGALYRYVIDPYWVLKTNFMYGSVKGSDNNGATEWQQERNLSFSSYIFELSQQVEFNFYPYSKRLPRQLYTPYLLTGIGLFHFRPTTTYNGDKVSLNRMGTEGQRAPANKNPNPYKLTQLAIPIGGGIKLNLGPHWNLNLEISIRKTITDYLDDVSTDYPDNALIYRYDDNPDKTVKLSKGGDTDHPAKREGWQRGEAFNKDDYAFFGLMLTYTFWDIRCPDISNRDM